MDKSNKKPQRKHTTQVPLKVVKGRQVSTVRGADVVIRSSASGTYRLAPKSS